MVIFNNVIKIIINSGKIFVGLFVINILNLNLVKIVNNKWFVDKLVVNWIFNEMVLEIKFIVFINIKRGVNFKGVLFGIKILKKFFLNF